jgi:hypothetical protein
VTRRWLEKLKKLTDLGVPERVQELAYLTANKVHVVSGVASFAVLSSEARIRASPGPGKANTSPTAQVMEASIFRVRERILATGDASSQCSGDCVTIDVVVVNGTGVNGTSVFSTIPLVHSLLACVPCRPRAPHMHSGGVDSRQWRLDSTVSNVVLCVHLRQKISRQLLDLGAHPPFELSPLAPRGFMRAPTIGRMEPRYLTILYHLLMYL